MRSIGNVANMVVGILALELFLGLILGTLVVHPANELRTRIVAL